MRILLDLQACQSGSRYGGIGRYSLSLAKALISEAANHDVYVVLNGLMPLHECELRLEFTDILAPDRFVSFSGCGPASASNRAHHIRKQLSESLREDFLSRLRPDIVHVASLVEGWGDDVVTSLNTPELSAKTAVTWYDLIPYLRPDMYLQDPNIAEHYYSKVDEAKRAQLLLAISQYTRDEAVEHLGFRDNQVVNIQAGVDGRFRPMEVQSRAASELNEQLGIRKPFLMYTGSFDTRKNQPALIQAFARLPTEVRNRYQLVIAGNGWPGVYGHLREIGRQAGLTDDCLVFTGRINDDQLLALYNMCHLFVFPSLCEGFGLPALEAMSCGTATIGSNCTSIPEVIGREDALFDPKSVQSISEKMYDVLVNQAFHDDLASHGLERAKRFTWRNSAQLALAAFEELHARQTYSQTSTVSIHSCLSNSEAESSDAIIASIAGSIAARNDCDCLLPLVADAIRKNERSTSSFAGAEASQEVKTGWVTTWGTRCGIASYSKYLIESAACKPSVILAEGKPGASRRRDDDTPVSHCWSAGEDDLSQLSREVRRRGLDVVYMQFNYGFFDFKALTDFIDVHTEAGVRIMLTLHSTQDPPPHISPKRLVEIRDALMKCERLLVHTEHDVARLHQLGIYRNVSLLAHGVHSVPARNMRESSWDTAKDQPFTIATYGFFLAHKGLLEMIEAFSDLHREDQNLRFLMLNAEYSPDASGEVIGQARQLVSKYKLDAHITMCTEYLADEESLERLAQADLIVYPYQQTGESSSAAVRMGLSSGRLVATTPLPIFDDVRDIVVRLPGVTPSELREGLSSLISRMRSGEDSEITALQERCDAWRQKYFVGNIADSVLSLSGKPPQGNSRAA